MRKFLSIILTLICTIVMFSSCAVVNEGKMLLSVERQGEYIIRQGECLYQGGKKVDIQKKIVSKIKKEKKMLGMYVNQGSYVLDYLEKDGEMYFLYCYKREVSDVQNQYRNGCHTVNYYAFGKTPFLNPNVTISEYFSLFCEHSEPMTMNAVGVVGNYVVFEQYKTPFEVLIYDSETLKRQPIELNGYQVSRIEDNALILWKEMGNEISLRIFDENLTEYEYTYPKGNKNDLFGDYLLISNEKEDTISGVNYKTGEELLEEHAKAMLEEETKPKTYPDFIYKGKSYSYVRNDAGNNLTEEPKQLTITIQEMGTDIVYSATYEEVWAIAPAMTQIRKIYKGDFDYCQIFAQDDELFFAFANWESFFGMTTKNTSPLLVFKYNEETKQLDYIGWAGTYGGITEIYKGSL